MYPDAGKEDTEFGSSEGGNWKGAADIRAKSGADMALLCDLEKMLSGVRERVEPERRSWVCGRLCKSRVSNFVSGLYCAYVEQVCKAEADECMRYAPGQKWDHGLDRVLVLWG